MNSLRILGLLLDYPGELLWDHQNDLLEAIDESEELTTEQRLDLALYVADFCQQELLDAQSAYTGLFDRGRATSLLLFEHVHGESRDRGQAMVDLLDQYRAAGLEIDSRELPDYLPLYLEYLSTLSRAEACSGLNDIAPILALLSARLQERNSHYAELFDLLLALSGANIATQTVRDSIKQEARDDTPAALDAVWEEEQIKFLGEQSCASGDEAAHQKRFAGAVAPQYLNLDDTPAGEPRK
ncbi:nitrate reductase molybdenum cofactor assembly chaperone [Ewingella americana]|jgi:nitrate reductase delta subunit|uniref:Nitrate reductase molybdenum cofactor assembly chaperone n=1 Tax=Ewingella americana TaxID=41202 RepID=A0A502GUP5_9GAMM|nr:nitrate reductase molybdenum cofactor assembly chaperone [Ewingella americana]TPG64696.1 nitrate reductase molybdenum cofactor assembly chaperone [Ewingella americana]